MRRAGRRHVENPRCGNSERKQRNHHRSPASGPLSSAGVGELDHFCAAMSAHRPSEAHDLVAQASTAYAHADHTCPPGDEVRMIIVMRRGDVDM
jgi:hypothetical protein